MTDKNKACIDYMLQCPQIRDNPLYFNAGVAQNNNNLLVSDTVDVAINKPYIDGSVLKRFTFTIITYKSGIYQPLVNNVEYPNENVTDMLDIQGIIDWITEQNDVRHFPDFGVGCTVDNIQAVTQTPNLNGIDSGANPPLIKYSIAVRVEYLDKNKCNWNTPVSSI